MVKILDKVDVVVVGSGWAGGIVAAEAAKAGHHVVVLERGHDKTTADYVGAKDELKYGNRYEMMQDLSAETVTSRNKLTETALPVRTQDEMMVGTNLGGGSVHWSGAVYRWLPYDFEIRSKTVERYGEGKIPDGMMLQDWGITYEEMEPYYDQFAQTAGLSGEQDPHPDAPEHANDYPNPPMKDTPNIRLFKDAAAKLGYHPFQVPSANLSEAYTNPDGESMNACVYCAFCSQYGCDFGAKSSPIVSVLPTAKKTGNCEIRTNSYARRVLKDGNKATGIFYVDTETGQEYEQPADVVVLGGFTFTNNRILLLSDIGTPYNPDTRRGVIGRNFNGQFNSAALGARGFFEKEKFNLYMGAGALGGVFTDLAGDNLDHTELPFLHGGAVEIRQYGVAGIGGNKVPDGTPLWGAEFKDRAIHYANRNLNVWFTPAIMPWWHNYTDLDPTYKDRFGDPLLRVTYRLTDQDRNIAKFGIDKCREVLEQMGADIIDEDAVPDEFNHVYFGGHYAGGVIMGDDPNTSALNNFLQMWDMDNLFVVGASAFPHFSNHHPTWTIGAVAYRAAEGVNRYLREGGGQLV